jgi:lipopolysaccharide/colanic/teichoic acid biosynthesis glycosyltransferase
VDISRRRTDVGGRPFTIYKFRTMGPRSGADEQVWATPDDPRVTAVGRVLRKYRLDELPQVWNVLRGDMNIVGPRPEQPSIFVNLRGAIAGYQDRQRVRPGITGWAQVAFPQGLSEEDTLEKVKYDIYYIKNLSFLMDVAIFLKTIRIVLFGQGH